MFLSSEQIFEIDFLTVLLKLCQKNAWVSIIEKQGTNTPGGVL